MNNLELQKRANEVRKGIVTAVHSAKAGHPGGSLSAADVFTFLYFEEMNIDPKNPHMENRDRFVLSKGHTAPGLYAALANRGYSAASWLLSAGTSLYSYSRRGYLLRFSGTGNFRGSRHGTWRKDEPEGFQSIHPVG